MVSLWKRKRDTYGRLTGWVNVVTEVEKQGPEPPPVSGCILADDMGLGKTISIISLIATTREDALAYAGLPPTRTREEAAFDALGLHGADDPVTLKSFANAYNMPSITGQGAGSRGGKGGKKQSKTAKKRVEMEGERLGLLKKRSRATLIVCPLSTVQNWESQIDEHVKHPGASSAGGGGAGGKPVEPWRMGVESAAVGVGTSALKVYVYHGVSRNTDVDFLADHDVIITTYSLLGYEYSRQNRGKEGKEDGQGQGGESSDGGVEEVDAEGNPVSGAATPNGNGGGNGKKGKKKMVPRKGDGTPSPLQAIQWFRVVLDEAHMIKEHTTIQARAACDLVAERRACLTGTPLQNSLNDLFSLVRFLRLEPFSDRSLWTAHIGAPAKLGDPLGVSRLQLIMRHLALRRTKASKDRKGKPILTLPVKREAMFHLDLDEREKAFYHKYHQRSKQTFLTLEKSDSLLKNYCSILQELLRLRQICAHMGLVAEGEDAKLAGGGGDDLLTSIKEHGLSKTRAVQLLMLMRDTGAAQCVECGVELIPAGMAVARDDMEEEKKPGARKKGKKKAPTIENEETLPPDQRPIVTRCQHLFCLACFRAHVCAGWPKNTSAGDRASCSTCREEITPVIDAIEVLPSELESYAADCSSSDAKANKASKKTKANTERVIEHSTKIRHLLGDLFPFSMANPASQNYSPTDVIDPAPDDPDADYKPVKGTVVKSVVFSQWTKLLDRIGDALDGANIGYGRLDGSMNRTERSRSMDMFRLDPSVEVLLVSLRAGGVGISLVSACRVYVMEPFWNPSVENQAVDRVHRLGQTRPVQTTRYIIRGSIEQNMLEIQRRKIELANMSMGQTLSKAELAKRRVDDLKTLFKDNGEMMESSGDAESGSNRPKMEEIENDTK